MRDLTKQVLAIKTHATIKLLVFKVPKSSLLFLNNMVHGDENWKKILTMRE